jgi:hypothetical protein
VQIRQLAAEGAPLVAARVLQLNAAATYGDEKVANRDIRLWHGATENGP